MAKAVRASVASVGRSTNWTATWWVGAAFRGIVLERGDLGDVVFPLLVLSTLTVILLGMAALLLSVRRRRGGLS